MNRGLLILLAGLSAALPLLASPLGAVLAHEIWALDQVVYPTQHDPSFAAEMVKAHSMDAVIAVLNSHKVQFERMQRKVDTRVLPSKVYAQISGLPKGEPFIVAAGDRSVASVIVGDEVAADEAAPN